MKAVQYDYAKVYRYAFLVVLMLFGTAVGLWQEIIILTLPDLHTKFNISYELLGRILSFRGIGNICSLLIVSYVYDSKPHVIHYLMISECIIGGACTIFIPRFSSFYIAVMLIYIQSICQSALNNACQVFVLKIFQKNSIGKMQIYHFGYGFGRFLTGFICRPFLSGTPNNRSKLTRYCWKTLNESYLTDAISNQTFNATSSEINRQFERAYFVVGSIAVAIACIFGLFKLLRNPITTELKKCSWTESIHPKFTANGRVYFGLALTVLLFLYYMTYLAGQSVLMPYLIVYSMDPCKAYYLTQTQATYLHSTVTACFILAQVTTCFVMDHHPIMILLSCNMLNVVFVAILTLYGNDYEVSLWICVCGMRVCNSVVYPSGTSYLNRYIVVTSSLITLSFVGATCGVIIGQAIGGKILDNYPSIVLVYACLVFMAALLLVSVVFISLTTKYDTRVFTSENGGL